LPSEGVSLLLKGQISRICDCIIDTGAQWQILTPKLEAKKKLERIEKIVLRKKCGIMLEEGNRSAELLEPFVH